MGFVCYCISSPAQPTCPLAPALATAAHLPVPCLGGSAKKVNKARGKRRRVVGFWERDALAQMLLRVVYLAVAGRMEEDVPDRWAAWRKIVWCATHAGW